MIKNILTVAAQVFAVLSLMCSILVGSIYITINYDNIYYGIIFFVAAESLLAGIIFEVLTRINKD